LSTQSSTVTRAIVAFAFLKSLQEGEAAR
jgi:hypothetical protein